MFFFVDSSYTSMMTLIEAISKFEFVKPTAIDRFDARGQRRELDDLPEAHLFQLFDLLDHSFKPLFIVWHLAARIVITRFRRVRHKRRNLCSN